MMVSTFIKYIVLANPNGYKARIVIDKLSKGNVLTPGNCLIITTAEEGGVAAVSNANNIGVLCVNRSELKRTLAKYNFDFLISCGWNYKISNEVIAMAAVASINCHSSYLPDYKGASAHKHAWANAEAFTGTTIHLLTSDFDGGNIIEQSKIKIRWFDTPKSLIRRIAEETAILLPKVISRLENDDFGTSQKELEGRYFFKTSNFNFTLLRLINLLLRLIAKPVYTKNKKV